MEAVEARAEQVAEEQAAEEREQKLQELQQERQKLLEAEEKLKAEQAELESRRAEILDSDDQELLERALSGKPLPAKSEFRRNEDRLSEIPSLLYGVRRRALQLGIEIAEAELVDLEEERVQLGRAAHEAHERLLEAQHERDMAQSLAAGAAADRDEKRRSINTLQRLLLEHEANKPATDSFVQQMNRHRVWRWGPNGS
jgi:hypothetical protein